MMYKDFDLNTLSELINDLEIKYKLFNKKIEDVFFWKIIRMKLYYNLAEKINLLDNPHPLREKSLFKRIFRVIQQDKLIFKNNAINLNEEKEILIIRSARKNYYNGNIVDIYTYFLEKEITIKNGDNYNVVEEDITNHILDSYQNNFYALEPKIKTRIAMLIKQLDISNEIKELIVTVEQEIDSYFGIRSDLLSLIRKETLLFNIRYEYYRKLLTKLNPKVVYLVCSYGKEPLISAAQKMGIKVIEIQHGTMSRHHFGYDYRTIFPIPYFPDEILLFGRFWSKSTKIPLKDEEIGIIGYPFLINQINRNKNCVRKNNQIVFLSQGTISKKLTKISIEFAKNHSKCNIIYKLHPSEYKEWRIHYPELVLASKMKNYFIIDNNSRNIYEILSESEFQVGVYSTLIYEGLALGLKTILVDLPGIEYMEYLIQNDMVMLVKNSAQLENAVTNYSCSSFNSTYFFADYKEIIK